MRVAPKQTTRGTASAQAQAVLLSAHYDAIVGSYGASDDLSGVAVLMEVMRNVAASEPLDHAIIFNLNGAEENVLQASHGFITDHEWRHQIKAFVNIEACGAGGKEIVFQSGAPWLVRLYADVVPHPSISVIAQEVFQTEVIPSDTDFRIYRDFGQIPGFDMAWYENGYVYHTHRDDTSQITPGSIQHAGENTLALARALASGEPAAGGGQGEGALIFFSVFGVWTLVWTAQGQFWGVCAVTAGYALLASTGTLSLPGVKVRQITARAVRRHCPTRVKTSLCVADAAAAVRRSATTRSVESRSALDPASRVVSTELRAVPPMLVPCADATGVTLGTRHVAPQQANPTRALKSYGQGVAAAITLPLVIGLLLPVCGARMVRCQHTAQHRIEKYI